MPEFAGQVRHSNASYPILDLTDDSGSQFNQTGKSPVKGMGVFSSVASRSSVTSRYRTKGYLAIVGDTPYVYTSGSTTNSSWQSEGNWAGLSATNGLPSGGNTHNALVKLSGSDYDAGWTGDPEFSTLDLKKSNHPSLNFLPNQSSPTPSSTILGRIESKGVASSGGGTQAKGPRIDFVQSGSSGASSVAGSIDFFVSKSSGGQVRAFTLNEEKTAIFAPMSSAPTPKLGGFYYNSTENFFYVGVEDEQ